MHTSQTDIFLGEDWQTFLQNWITAQAYTKIAILVDENTKQFCYPMLVPALPQKPILIEIQSGEEQKNIQTCQYIWKQLTENQVDRKSLLINLGGGVICDMGGFCAATFKRGIDFVHIPTTLLAQVDASIGGKLGIDFQNFKNQIGLFALPQHILIETSFLKTLPTKELYAGLAEVIKHCLIADAQMFDNLRQWKHLFTKHLPTLVNHSIKIKNQITQADFKEQNIRKNLNFGHTIGHALESYLLDITNRKILHGEAIIVGMFCEAWLAKEKGLFPAEQFFTIENYLKEIYPQKIFFELEEIASIAALCWQDKKNENQTILIATLKAIGEAHHNYPITQSEIEKALFFYQKRWQLNL